MAFLGVYMFWVMLIFMAFLSLGPAPVKAHRKKYINSGPKIAIFQQKTYIYALQINKITYLSANTRANIMA